MHTSDVTCMDVDCYVCLYVYHHGAIALRALAIGASVRCSVCLTCRRNSLIDNAQAQHRLKPTWKPHVVTSHSLGQLLVGRAKK